MFEKLTQLLRLKRNRKDRRDAARRQFLAGLKPRVEQLEDRRVMAIDLGVGDIAFTGLQTDAPDTVSFVLLKDVDNSTTLTFTDNGWATAQNGWANTTENTITVTFGSNYTVGTHFAVVDGGTPQFRLAGTSTSAGTVAGGSLSGLSASGDSVLAYQGVTPTTGSATNWVAGISSNSWGSSSGSNFSALPSALTLGSTAVGFASEVDNQGLSLTTVSGDIASIRTTVNTASNWTRSDTAITLVPPATTFTVLPSNTAPALDNSKSPILNAIDEDAASPTGAVGTLVSSLVDFASPSGQVDNVTDPDSGALLGIAVTAADTANGHWFYSTDNGSNWTSLGSVSNSSARLLAADANTRLYFQPNANYNGTVSSAITFRAWDRVSGTNGATADTSTNGGAAAFSADTDTASIVVNSINDAPAGTDKTVATNVDTDYAFVAADFGFTDPSDSPANSFNSVTIATLPAAGTLKLSGTPVAANDVIAVASIANLTFSPASGASGAPYATFTFQVQDDGGTSAGGVDLDPTPNRITINVNATVNHAPAGADQTITINEDSQYTLVVADFGFTDPNDTPANSFLAVKITTLPTAGTLSLSGNAVSAGDFVTVANLPNLKFSPAAHANGTNYGSFTFQVQDDGGTAGGGVDLDPSANAITFNVTSVNDAPAGTDGAVSTLEDTDYAFSAADFGFTDSSDSPANAFQGVKIVTLPGAGTLKLSGNAVSANDVVPVGSLSNLKFTPAANANGSNYASFTFQVQDDGGTANGGVDLDPTANNLTVNVTSVNDAPSGADKSVSTVQDTDYTFSAADFALTDPNDSPANALLAVKIASLPAEGTLKLSGNAVAVNDVIAVASLGNLKFTPAAGATGSPYTTFTFQVQDNGGTANGGVDVDPTSNTISVNVTSIPPAAFTGGNVVVYRVGDGTSSLVNTGNKVFLDEYTPSGTLVQSIELPSSGAGNKLIASGTASSEGMLTLAADGKSLVLTGYNVATGGASSVSGTASGTVPRVVGLVDQTGAIDVSTSTNASSSNNVRSAARDGNNLWIVGGAGGVQYVSVGGSTVTQVNTAGTALANIRTVNVTDGKLYVSTGSGAAFRIASVANGANTEPTAAGASLTNLPGYPTSGSPYQFVLLDLDAGVAGVDTLYVADDGAGIQKYSLVAGNWASNGSLAAASIRGLTGKKDGTNVVLYGTTGATDVDGGGTIYTLTDASGYNATISGTVSTVASVLDTSNKAFRGVAFAPYTAGQSFLSFSTPTVSHAEGNSGSTSITFTVRRTGDTSGASSVNYAVTGTGTNQADAADFVGGFASGTVTFAAGSVESQPITIQVSGDTTVEPDETFLVTISSPTGASLGSQVTATGTIVDDDNVPNLTITADQVSLAEGNSGTTAFTFTITRSNITTGTTTVDWTAAGSGTFAANGSDFSGAVSGSVTFNDGETSKPVTVNIAGDATVEPDETFSVTLSNVVNGAIIGATATSTITNDDTAVSIAADAASALEGNSGSTPFTFTVTRSGVATGVADVDWAVTGAAGSGSVAAVDADFTGGSLPAGTVHFDANEVTKAITINVAGNTAYSADKRFTVTLSNPTGAGLGAPVAASSVITNDDFQNLQAGDIVITGINTANPDQFSFVPLVALEPNSVILFTDNAWTGSALTSNEGVLTYVAPATGLAAGTKVIVQSDTTNGVTMHGGTLGSGVATSNFSLNSTGDNLFAYVGQASSPTFLFGLTTDSTYTPTGVTTSTTFLPSGLTVGTSAVAPLAPTGTIGNGACDNSVTSGSVATLRSAVADVTKWTTSGTAITLSTTNFTVTGSATPTVTVTSGDQVYSGLVYVPTTTVTGGSGDPSSPILTYSYFVGADVGGASLGSSAPANSGTYTVVAHFAGDSVYAPADSAPNTFHITKAALTATVTANNKEYDGNTNATVSYVITSGLVGSETVTASGAGTFADKNVGNGKTVTLGTITLADGSNGGLASNYSLAAASNPTADITAKALSATAAASNKVYDGNTNATVTVSLAGVIGSEVVTAAGTGAFDTKNVGTGKTVSVSGIALSGADAGNYSVGGTATTTADITAKALSASAAASNKVYDGNTNATVTVSLAGVIGSEVVTAAGTGAFDTKNVGTGKTVSVSGIALSGADAGNYSVGGTATTTADITAKALSASAAASNKVYDGNTDATVTVTLAGVIGSEVVTAAGTGAFGTKNVGTGKTVSVSGIALSGADAGNYSVGGTASTTADITAKALSASAAASNKVYDGNTNATVTVSLAGVIGSETVTAAGSGAFDTKNFGTGKTVSVSGIALSGADAGNYSVGGTATTTADITTKALSATAAASNKEYDGTTAAVVDYVITTGLVGTETVSAAGSGTFADKDAGLGKTVSLGAITLSDGTNGGLASNYSLATPANPTADISPKELTASVTASDKMYDASTAAAVDYLITAGLVGAETVTATGAGTFANKHVGAGKPVSLGAITLHDGTHGGLASNYSLATPTSPTANITAKGLTGSITAANKVYDGTTSATISGRSLSGAISGDDVSYVGGTATFNTAAVGTGKTVTATGLSLSGTDAGNYTVNGTATTTADITAPPNMPPVIDPQTFTINSKSLTGALVGAVVATDADAGSVLSYAITNGNADGAFSIDATTGVIRVADYKKLPKIAKGSTFVNAVLTVTATDNGFLGNPAASGSGAVTVKVDNTGIEMPPTVNGSTFTIAENNKKTDGSTKVGTIKPLAAYAGQKFTFNGAGLGLTGADAASFNLDTKGVLTLASGVSLDFETKPSYSFQVKVAGSVDTSKVTTANVTVTVKNLNEAPVYSLVDGANAPVTITQGKGSLTLDESIPTNATQNGLVIGKVTATDPDQLASTLDYQLNGKGQAIVLDKTGAFAYNAATGEISILDASKVSFEKSKKISLSFIVTDDPIAGDPKSKSISTKLSVAVNLNDLNEAPVISSVNTFSITENNKANAKVGTVKAKDTDTKAATKQTLTYSIQSQKDAANAPVTVFAIDPATGGITVPTAGALNYESSASYTLVVRVTDSGTPSLYTEQTITVNVLDQNELFVFTLQDAANVAATGLTASKGAANGTKIGRLLVSDVDAGLAGSYATGALKTLVETGSKGALTLDETTGDITILDKTKLSKKFKLSLSLKDQAAKPVTSKFSFEVQITP